jgi:hypothetical protein
MKAWALLLALSLTPCFTCVLASADKQQDSSGKTELRVPTDLIGIWQVWDDARSEFVSFGTYQRRKTSATPLVRIYNVLSGEKRSIDVFKDFPNASYVAVEAFAVARDGSIVLACEVGGITPERILVYDKNLALVRNLSAERYGIGAVAMDEDQSIFILGTREYEYSSQEAYPLIVKYDSYGKVTQEMLPRSLFSRFFDPTQGRINDSVLYPSFVGSNALLRVNGKEISVYLPAAGALIVLDYSGKIQRLAYAADALSEFTRSRGYKALQVNSNYLSPTGDLWLEGLISEPLDGPGRSTTYSQFLVRFTPQGQLQTVNERSSRDQRSALPFSRLIGFTVSNEPVMYFPGDTTLLIQKKPF